MMPKIMNIPSSNKRVAVLSFSDISKDGRVLRHAEYISRLAPVILLGMGYGSLLQISAWFHSLIRMGHYGIKSSGVSRLVELANLLIRFIRFIERS